jgi:hypothetical protein
MAWLRIPSQHVADLENLLSLENGRVDELTTTLKKVSPTWDSGQLLASEFDKDQSLLVGIIKCLLSLTALRLRLDLDPFALANNVCEAMNDSEHEKLRTQGEEKESFVQRLAGLLSIESLLYPTKGPTLLLAHEYVFTHARIITDIRPIFGSDITTEPSLAAIVHTLQLTCQHGDKIKDFYVAMDKDDLNLLDDVLKRAALKADNLRSVLQKTGITTIWE